MPHATLFRLFRRQKKWCELCCYSGGDAARAWQCTASWLCCTRCNSRHWFSIALTLTNETLMLTYACTNFVVKIITFVGGFDGTGVAIVMKKISE